MIESPFIQELVAEANRTGKVELVLLALERRFGAVTPIISAGVKQVKEEEKLVRLNLEAATCASLNVFEEALRQELPTPPPVSTRGKRRTRKPPT